jgi:hypothetical protein
MSEDPKQPKSDERAQNQGISFPLHVVDTSNVELRPHIFSYGAIKDAKRLVLQSLSGSGAATVIEIVTGTTLPFDLASVVIGDLETEGKVTVKVNEGLKWVELKK